MTIKAEIDAYMSSQQEAKPTSLVYCSISLGR